MVAKSRSASCSVHNGTRSYVAETTRLRNNRGCRNAEFRWPGKYRVILTVIAGGLTRHNWNGSYFASCAEPSSAQNGDDRWEGQRQNTARLRQGAPPCFASSTFPNRLPLPSLFSSPYTAAKLRANLICRLMQYAQSSLVSLGANNLLPFQRNNTLFRPQTVDVRYEVESFGVLIRFVISRSIFHRRHISINALHIIAFRMYNL